MIPIGKATRALPSIRSRVPTIAGKIPPEVIPSAGASVRKSQLMTPAPFTTMKPSMANNTITIARLRILNIAKARACARRFRRLYPSGYDGLSIFYLFFARLREEMNSTHKLMKKVMKNRITPRRNSD